MSNTTETEARPSGITWWVSRVVAWMAILAITAVIALSVLIPRIVGATPYTILTGSMRPGLPPGAMVVVRPVAIEDIAVGEVITYQLASGEPTLVTHRVVGVGINARGERVFTTQGDANSVADARPVRPVQIKGELWYSVPHLGFANRYVSGGQRELTTTLVVAGLLAYAGFMAIGAVRERGRDLGPGHQDGAWS